jgi:hypothetical protein
VTSPAASVQGSAFSLSAALTPTLTYSEFALICGSSLLSPEDCQPVARLGRCLEQLIATAHITWALCVVQALGATLRDQYARELGLRASASLELGDKSASKKAAGRSGASDRDKNKPFKINWVSKWIDLDGNIEEDGASAQGGAQKEHVLIPGGMSHALRVFLHKVTQHGSTSVVSIDTMQRCATTAAPTVATRAYAVVASEGGGANRVNGGSSTGKSGKSGRNPAPPRDEFSDLLGEVQEVSDQEDEEGEETNAFFEPSGLLATLAGVDGDPARVILSHVAMRVLTLLSLAYVQHVSLVLLRAARPAASITAAGSAEALEDAAMQSVFDLSVLQTVATQWNLRDWRSTVPSRSQAAVTGFTTAVEQWRTHLDPITAELVMPLVTTAVTTHAQCLSLLVPHCSDTTTTHLAETASSNTPTPRAPVGGKMTEQLLARVFPSATHSAARFALLPVAISAAPAPVTIASRPASTGHMSSTPQQSSSARTGAGSGTNLPDANAAPAAAAQSVSSKVKAGVMNWWG